MKRKLIFILPLILFLIIASAFYWQLNFGRDPSSLPSVMIDKKAPDINLPTLDKPDGEAMRYSFSSDNPVKTPVSIVNFYASWCAPCRVEHPFLQSLNQRSDITMIGISYKDKPTDTIAYLNELGPAYDHHFVDINGRHAIEWGLYGVPETYIIDEKGMIRYKYTGPLYGEIALDGFMQALNDILP